MAGCEPQPVCIAALEQPAAPRVCQPAAPSNANSIRGRQRGAKQHPIVVQISEGDQHDHQNGWEIAQWDRREETRSEQQDNEADHALGGLERRWPARANEAFQKAQDRNGASNYAGQPSCLELAEGDPGAGRPGRSAPESSGRGDGDQHAGDGRGDRQGMQIGYSKFRC